MTPQELNDLIKSRRSVFQNDYSGQPVDEAIIVQMLENANWAPNHKLTEPWRFIVYNGEGLKKLASLQAEYYKKVTTADGSFQEGKYQGLLTKPMLSSYIIAIGMKRDERKSLPVIEEEGAVFCAIQNMYLTATAYNIGCYLSTGGITHFKGAQEIFGWGPDDELIGFLHVGMPKGPIQAGRRKAVTEKVVWVKE